MNFVSLILPKKLNLLIIYYFHQYFLNFLIVIFSYFITCFVIILLTIKKILFHNLLKVAFSYYIIQKNLLILIDLFNFLEILTILISITKASHNDLHNIINQWFSLILKYFKIIPNFQQSNLIFKGL